MIEIQLKIFKNLHMRDFDNSTDNKISYPTSTLENLLFFEVHLRIYYISNYNWSFPVDGPSIFRSHLSLFYQGQYAKARLGSCVILGLLNIRVFSFKWSMIFNFIRQKKFLFACGIIFFFKFNHIIPYKVINDEINETWWFK
jgi:hypothetical protein